MIDLKNFDPKFIVTVKNAEGQVGWQARFNTIEEAEAWVSQEKKNPSSWEGHTDVSIDPIEAPQAPGFFSRLLSGYVKGNE